MLNETFSVIFKHREAVSMENPSDDSNNENPFGIWIKSMILIHLC